MICITGIIVRGSENVTKKALVRFDPENPESRATDFVAPVQIDHNEVRLASTKDGKFCQYGLVVFTGRETKAVDLFAKVIDAGQYIYSVDSEMIILENFVEKLGSCKIGSVLEFVKVQSEIGFDLKPTELRLR